MSQRTRATVLVLCVIPVTMCVLGYTTHARAKTRLMWQTQTCDTLNEVTVS